jgi:hypothetical protein
VADARTFLKPVRPADPGERLAARAVRAEIFGDQSLASSAWKRLKADSKSPDQRPWFLLAAQKVGERKSRDADADDPKARLEFARKRLAEAVEMKPANPREAKVVGQDIVELYESDPDPDFAGLAEEAGKILLK